jgi:pimeloyl-ACP methyl ester carboxylesterase
MPIAADLYYQIHQGGEEGQKPPVILIHGAGGSHLHWPIEVRRLPRYRVFALDLPGHGQSGGRGQQSIAGYAAEVAGWLEAAGLHSAVFVGHSMGSAIALSLALDYPEHVVGLGLVGAGARLQVNPTLLESAANPTTFHNAVEMTVQWSYGPEAPANLVELAARRMAEIRPSVLHGDFLACTTFDESDRIASIHSPTLVLCGAEDRMTPQRQAQFLAANIPGAHLVVIPGAGHMVMLEQPQATANALQGFLDGVRYP